MRKKKSINDLKYPLIKPVTPHAAAAAAIAAESPIAVAATTVGNKSSGR